MLEKKCMILKQGIYGFFYYFFYFDWREHNVA